MKSEARHSGVCEREENSCPNGNNFVRQNRTSRQYDFSDKQTRAMRATFEPRAGFLRPQTIDPIDSPRYDRTE